MTGAKVMMFFHLQWKNRGGEKAEKALATRIVQNPFGEDGPEPRL